jgi:trans-aconitate 2-methyltransferase
MSQRDCWNPNQYEKFRAERTQPFYDLLALVEPCSSMRVVDLGCGTGELTALLHQRLGARETLGIDSSDAMLERARRRATPSLRFERGDLAAPPAGPWDLVFSNSALHWAPDHASLLPRLVARVAPAGQLAIQVPANHGHPAHQVARALAREPPFADALAGASQPEHVLAPARYAEILDAAGLVDPMVRLQVYVHHLPSGEDVVEWVRGSLLTFYEARLPAPLYQDFLREYHARLVAAIGQRAPYTLTYDRILLRARAKSAGSGA